MRRKHIAFGYCFFKGDPTVSSLDVLPEVRSWLSHHHGHYIAGRSVPGSNTGDLSVINPATEEVIASVAEASSVEVDAAVQSSLDAFRGIWATTLPAERGNILLKVAECLQSHREELAQLATLETGKTISISRLFEIDQSCAFLRYYAGVATRINGQTISPSIPSISGERYTAFTHREPVGPVAGIVPWNFPILIAVWKFASAIATGCTSIIKP